MSAPDLLGETELPDGRTLGWARWGPPEGTPVLFFSGAAMGRGLGFGADALGRLGARLIAVPVDLWYGGHDASSVHSPDHGAELARRIPASRRHLLPEAGGSLLWTHAEEILTSLLDAVRR
ncbi:alpha/beta fold hydrolase [Microtetraspora malaysiensis]|uniref:alpha/beta fold hydrolase n=1 Tax=Microtetraspora malaysiensis TaxID=161358 RepID=UPI00082DDADA|nr:hypothetical protein [Microtetraspora malaysiensis]